MLKKISTIPFYPILLSLYFPLALYLINIEEVVFSATTRAFVFAVGLTLIIFGGTRLVWKTWNKAALFAALILFLFFTYGHIFNLAQTTPMGRHRYFIPLWVILLGLGLLLFRGINPKSATPVMNLVVLVSLAFLLVQIGIFQVRAQRVLTSVSTEETAPQTNNAATASGSLPDVYYIILDAYSRQDVLKQDYNLDIGDFIHKLEAMGFVVPKCAQSNYDRTIYSMTSSLNMSYLEDLGFELFPEANFPKAELTPYIRQSAVRKNFEEMGYATVAFKSVHPQLDIANSTYYFDYFMQSGNTRETETISFHYLFLRTTALLPLVEYNEANASLTSHWPSYVSLWLPTSDMLVERNYRQYQQNVYLLDTLAKLPELPGPKFVYAHLIITHQPFVFTPEGRFRGITLQDNKAYRDQILYTNSAMPEILQTIIEHSATPPIIVMQSDHGYPHSPQRIKILNAYYLPNGGSNLLYPDITPVNTFRLIFNYYFGGHYEMLDDVSYLATETEPVIFTPIGHSCVDE